MLYSQKIQNLKPNEIISLAFPKQFYDDVQFVLKSLISDDISVYNGSTNNLAVEFLLLSQEQIILPYRIRAIDKLKPDILFTKEQETIYHCIFSRHSDGFIREKHIKALLQQQVFNWTFPFILKLCDEYVMEILSTIYECLNNQDTTQLKNFCKLNCPYFLYSYARMISYWNYFYRNKCCYYKNYIGRKLYMECFGYSKYLEKVTERYKIK